MTDSTETWLDMKRRHKREIIAAVDTALSECDGNQTYAARLLDMDRGAMCRLMRNYGIQWPTPRVMERKRREQDEGR